MKGERTEIPVSDELYATLTDLKEHFSYETYDEVIAHMLGTIARGEKWKTKKE
jgi:hypothetical protein